MAIETVDDIVEELMNLLGVFGACDEDHECKRTCRCCATSHLRSRLDEAYKVEEILSSFRRPA